MGPLKPLILTLLVLLALYALTLPAEAALF